MSDRGFEWAVLCAWFPSALFGLLSLVLWFVPSAIGFSLKVCVFLFMICFTAFFMLFAYVVDKDIRELGGKIVCLVLVSFCVFGLCVSSALLGDLLGAREKAFAVLGWPPGVAVPDVRLAEGCGVPWVSGPISKVLVGQEPVRFGDYQIGLKSCDIQYSETRIRCNLWVENLGAGAERLALSRTTTVVAGAIEHPIRMFRVNGVNIPLGRVSQPLPAGGKYDMEILFDYLGLARERMQAVRLVLDAEPEISRDLVIAN